MMMSVTGCCPRIRHLPIPQMETNCSYLGFNINHKRRKLQKKNKNWLGPGSPKTERPSFQCIWNFIISHWQTFSSAQFSTITSITMVNNYHDNNLKSPYKGWKRMFSQFQTQAIPLFLDKSWIQEYSFLSSQFPPFYLDLPIYIVF